MIEVKLIKKLPGTSQNRLYQAGTKQISFNNRVGSTTLVTEKQWVNLGKYPSFCAALENGFFSFQETPELSLNGDDSDTEDLDQTDEEIREEMDDDDEDE